MEPFEAMRKSLGPMIIILAGIAMITFNRYMADTSVRTYRMMRVRLLIPEKYMPNFWVAIGVFTIFVGTLFLFETLGL
jgi:hypothetical protein